MPDLPATRRVKSIPTPVPRTDEESLSLTINGKTFYHQGDPEMPLLWFLRDYLRLTGTKYSCGIGICGACTALIDGKAQRTCLMPMKALANKEVITIEGLEKETLHRVQQAWIEEDVAQCGYCQTGQIMSTIDLLKRKPDPSSADIDQLSNLCRCGTYPRIRKAIKRASELMRDKK